MQLVHNGKRVSPAYNGTIRPCPSCFGHPLSDPFNQVRLDISCLVCGGTGTVDLAAICACGRPLCFVYKGQKVCASIACLLEIDKKSKEVENKTVTLPIITDQSDDDAEFSAEWARNLC